MGFNATVVVCMDQIDYAKKDSSFGENLADACIYASTINRKVHVDHGVTIIEVHHADLLVPVVVGGNTGSLIRGPSSNEHGLSTLPASTYINPNEDEYNTNVRLLKEIAATLGYRVSKIRAK